MCGEINTNTHIFYFPAAMNLKSLLFAYIFKLNKAIKSDKKMSFVILYFPAAKMTLIFPLREMQVKKKKKKPTKQITKNKKQTNTHAPHQNKLANLNKWHKIGL